MTVEAPTPKPSSQSTAEASAFGCMCSDVCKKQGCVAVL